LSIDEDPCFETEISGAIENMYYRIKKLDPNIVLQDFAGFTDFVGTCGGLTY